MAYNFGFMIGFALKWLVLIGIPALIIYMIYRAVKKKKGK